MAPGKRKNPQNALTSDSPYMLVDFYRDFPDDEACLQWLWRQRYSQDGEHAFCERCEQERVFHRYVAKQQRQDWTCTACGLHVHPTAGTIFHKSSTSLHLWFYAMYLMTSTRSGISAKQLERELGVTYKTAWRIFNLIRKELMTQDDDEPLSDEVEMDEMYVGGKPRHTIKNEWAKLPTKSGRYRAAMNWREQKKARVFGMVERDGGRVRAYVVPSTQRPTLERHVTESVKPDSVVYTDDAKVYQLVLPQSGYADLTVNHSSNVYVSRNIHTQTIEGFWSQVKRGITGVHHAVSHKHLQSYVNEHVWRFNHRNDMFPMFFTLASSSAATVGEH